MNNRCIRCSELCETTFVSFNYNNDPNYNIKNVNVKCIQCLRCRYEYYRTMDGTPIKIRIWAVLDIQKSLRQYEIAYRFPAFTASGTIKNFTVNTQDLTYSRTIEIKNNFDFYNPDAWLIGQAIRVINLESFS